MKAIRIAMLWLCIYTAGLILQSTFTMATEKPNSKYLKVYSSEEILRKEAFEILDSKCNVCHRKQNPFMVFKEKNMSKRAKKIYQVVFVERRMPMGNDIHQ